MMEGKNPKIVKAVKIDVNKCTGCRVCELICSAFHSEPKYSVINPKRSRIRVLRDEEHFVNEGDEP